MEYIAYCFKMLNAIIMQIIVFLIVISLTVAGGFLFAFFWAVRDGQFDDDYTPSMRLLVDDDMVEIDNSSKTKSENKKNNR